MNFPTVTNVHFLVMFSCTKTPKEIYAKLQNMKNMYETEKRTTKEKDSKKGHCKITHEELVTLGGTKAHKEHLLQRVCGRSALSRPTLK